MRPSDIAEDLGDLFESAWIKSAASVAYPVQCGAAALVYASPAALKPEFAAASVLNEYPGRVRS